MRVHQLFRSRLKVISVWINPKNQHAHCVPARNPGSEAFSTGQALYALGRLGRDGADPAVERAWKFLLATQLPDGSWAVPQDAINTRPRKLNVYTYWGTAWSAIGVLQTLPGPHMP